MTESPSYKNNFSKIIQSRKSKGRDLMMILKRFLTTSLVLESKILNKKWAMEARHLILLTNTLHLMMLKEI